ncbi:27586_t:CDS:2 [Racocetra persica]|uniref:27586_t:CDS:1 n=1 Tax=Racocetra persica TaxID=160502 RepID=A0ACA9KNB0_9GLOM|nr:27586_t:CDS:2 [Racocetra persica]
MAKNQKSTLEKAQEYKKYLEELEDPNYQGGSWSLPQNPTPLEQAKYEICKQVVSYKLDTELSTEAVAKKIQLSKAETEDILYYRIDYFTLDRLVFYASRLFQPLRVKMVMTTERTDERLQASLREVKKIVQKESSELTSSDWGDLQHEMKFLQERLGDEDNYEKLEELTNKWWTKKANKRAEKEGVNNNLLETEGITASIKGFEAAEGLISDGFWRAFTELLKSNRQQYSQETITALDR